MCQFVEMMCNEDFLNKDPDEAWEYLDFLAESAQNWDTSDGTEHLKQSNQSKGGGMYLLKNEEDDVNARIASLTRKIEALELGKGKQPTLVCRICECDTILLRIVQQSPHLERCCMNRPMLQILTKGHSQIKWVTRTIPIGGTTPISVGEMGKMLTRHLSSQNLQI